MSKLNTIVKNIETELEFFDKTFKKNILTDSGLLSTIIGSILKRKGKQLRPILVFLSAGACNSINERSHTAATLIELMHTATLIHDDVVDDSNMRRGFFTINSLWKNKIAVLIGDYLLARGLLYAVKMKEYQILEVVTGAVDAMSRGEILQLKKSRLLNITEEEYFEITEKKTASLIASCTKAGAISSGADDEVIQAMYNFGINLGIAFQIKDDLFDYQMDNKTGKPAGNDLKEKKLTLPVIFSKKYCNNKERRKLMRIIKSKKYSVAKIENFVAIVSASGGLEYATKRMIEYKMKAIDCLGILPDSKYKTSLLELVDFVVDRDL